MKETNHLILKRQMEEKRKYDSMLQDYKHKREVEEQGSSPDYSEWSGL
jgi:hypothetical protein